MSVRERDDMCLVLFSRSFESPCSIETSSVPLSNSKGMMHYSPNMHSGSTLLVSPEVVGRLGKVITAVLLRIVSIHANPSS